MENINEWITYKAKYIWLWDWIGEGNFQRWYKDWLIFRKLLNNK